MVELTQMEFTLGLVCIILSILYINLVVNLIYKSYIKRDINILYLAATQFFLSIPFLSMSIAFLFTFLTGNPRSEEIQLFLENPITFNCLLYWILLCSDILFKKNKKTVIVLAIIYVSIFESIFAFLFVSGNHSLIAARSDNISVMMGPFSLTIAMINMMIFFITSYKLFREARESESKEIRIKGVFILFGTVLYFVGVMATIVASLIKIPLFIYTTIIFFSFSIFGFYGGFIFPNWMKNLFLQEK